jgi:hypothetical protein
MSCFCLTRIHGNTEGPHAEAERALVRFPKSTDNARICLLWNPINVITRLTGTAMSLLTALLLASLPANLKLLMLRVELPCRGYMFNLPVYPLSLRNALRGTTFKQHVNVGGASVNVAVSFLCLVMCHNFVTPVP